MLKVNRANGWSASAGLQASVPVPLAKIPRSTGTRTRKRSASDHIASSVLHRKTMFRTTFNSNRNRTLSSNGAAAAAFMAPSFIATCCSSPTASAAAEGSHVITRGMRRD